MNNNYYNTSQNQQYPPPPMPQQGYNNYNYYNNQQDDPYAQQQQYHSQQTKPVNPDEKFRPAPKYQDLWAAILYLVTLAAFVVFSVFVIKDFKYNFKEQDGTQSDKKKIIAPIIALVISAVVSLGLSIGYLILMQIIPTFLIKFSFIVSIILMFVTGIIYIISKGTAGFVLGGLMILSGCLYIYLYFNWRSKIPFSSLMLQTVSKFTRKYPGTIFVGLTIMILTFVWMIYWSFTFFSSYIKYNSCSSNSKTTENCKMKSSFWGILAFSLFALYWTSQLLKDITHTTIAGAFASDYFSPEGGRLTTLAALKRTMTTSFGSVCFGSLLVSIVRLLRALVNQAARDSDNGFLAFLACCIACILSQIEYLIEYFNTYAYTYVAMYGTAYIESGKSTWNLIKGRGIEAIINDNLISNVLTIGGLFIAALSALCTFIYLNITTKESGGYVLAFTILGFVLAMLINSIIMQVIESANTSFFVCLAEDPQALQQYNPVLYQKILETYPGAANPI